MEYDVLKYHLVTTLINSQQRIFHIQNEFRKLSNNPEFKVNFYYGLNTTRLSIIPQNNYFDKYYQIRNTGFIGCVSSLLGCINYAKMMNWPYLFVFEDDIRFVYDSNKINKYIDDELDYKMLVLGYRNRFSMKEYNQYLCTPRKYFPIYGGYAYLINSSYYDFMIQKINDDLIMARDHIYFKKLYNDLEENIYFLKDKLVKLSHLNDKSTIKLH